MDTPKTLLEASRYFADITVCEDYMRSIRWADGEPECPKCKSNRIGEIATRRMLRCRDCRKQFTSRLGTVAEDSPLPLGHWYTAIVAVAHEIKITSAGLAALLGCTQASAWGLLKKIKTAREIANGS